MNLGGLISGFRNNDNDNDRNRNIIVIIIIVIIIFGFGYGRSLFGGFGGGCAPNYGAYAEYAYVDPRNRNRKKGSSHHRHCSDDGAVLGYGAGYGYGYPGGYGGYGYPGGGYGGFGYPGFGGLGGFFGNDWIFIIAIILLLFLLGGEREEREENNIIDVDTCM
jgi:hypothetical protein